jgi:hypothetical protein
MHVHVCKIKSVRTSVRLRVKEGGGGGSGSVSTYWGGGGFSVYPYLHISKCPSAPSNEHMQSRTQHRVHLFGYHGSEFIDLLVQLL